MTSVDAEIDALCQAVTKAFNARNLDGVMDCYTEDCIWVTSDSGVVKGRENVRKEYASFMDKFDSFDMKHVERIYSGDLCAEVGHSTIIGKGETIKARYCVTYIKEEGQWKFEYDASLF